MKAIHRELSPKESLFGFLAPLLRSDKQRWILLDGLPPRLHGDLVSYLRDTLGVSLDWVISSERDLRFFNSRESDHKSDWVVLDGSDEPDRKTLRSQIKRLLRDHNGSRFLILGNGETKLIDISTAWGSGTHHNFEDSNPFSEDDSALLQHARKLTPKYGLTDLILGPGTSLRFQECLHYIRTKEFCLNDWGFRKRHSRGHGITLLFHGESGTGKTMAAEVVAKTLNLPLYQVDLSAVVSKWIGETEKNLKSIFKAASKIKGILLFDEGDAIFGQRTKVEGSQDRYNNLEVNYLLQELEVFDGIVILSTNHEKNMDLAFLRRFTYALNFGYPDGSRRLSIWERNIPADLPLGKSVDLNLLSQFSLSGGNIRNCIRDGAARAASLDSPIVEQVHFLWAIKRELQKHGRELDRKLVGEVYWPLVASEWEYKNAPMLPEISVLP